MMNLRDSTFLVASAGHLTLALISFSRLGKSPLGLPLALLTLDCFGFSFATLCHHQWGHPWLGSVDAAFTALAPLAVLYLVVAFVGARRRYRTQMRVACVWFGALAVSSLGALLSPAWSAWVDSAAWSGLFLLGWLPILVLGLWILAVHLRASDAREQMRTRLVLAALFLGGALASTDLARDVGVPLPQMSALGPLLSTVLLAIVALRFGLFDRDRVRANLLYSVTVAVAAICLYWALFQSFSGHVAVLLFGVSVVTWALLAVVREVTSALASDRERIDRLAVLGRLSAQMAHDLKNPLAALVGAVQVLEHATEDSAEFRALIIEQAQRIRVVVEKYERLGRVEPILTLVDLGALAHRVTKLARHGSGKQFSLHMELGAGCHELELDGDLIASALENLVQNAIEALGENGHIWVRTEIARETEMRVVLSIAVQDTGEGMDARTLERATSDFYTTKTGGSGLGLAFARRVALAHGGDVLLASRAGVGTTVTLKIPCREPLETRDATRMQAL
jgi:two-component system, NtrC family, sensor histidine kinase HydH